MKHGTASGYQRHKCRCDACRAANAEHHARYRKANPNPYPQWRRLKQWPLEPLLELFPDARDILDIDWTVWQGCVERGLSDRHADQWACRLGIHPSLVWDGWWDAGLAPLDDQFVNGGPGSEPGWRQAAGYVA